MLDPFPAPPWLRDATRPFSNKLHLYTLPLHIHEILLSYAAYTLINSVLSPYASARLLSAKYAQWPRRTQLQWNMHVTAFLNSIVLSSAALYVMYTDMERLNSTWEERLWGYTGLAGLVQAVGAGYFVWDVQVCVANLDTLGVVDLLHALVALGISITGYYPFGLYYGMLYALIELSTPFVNIHWFLNKLELSGSRAHLVNGLLLITTFATCRLAWGSYLTVVFFRDVWTALHTEEKSTVVIVYGEPGSAGKGSEMADMVLKLKTPWWLAAVFMGCNAVVMVLSSWWFSKMVSMVRARFSKDGGKEKVIASSRVNTSANGNLNGNTSGKINTKTTGKANGKMIGKIGGKHA